ncbi:MAG: Uma2 family endonuclease [Chloroflexota bacterium]|nr:Uma2 family endonuclease [Chloroflexota bacterium]
MVIDTYAQVIHLATSDGAIIEGSDALQGTWTAEQYLRITGHTNRHIEVTDGQLELLPMPTDKHQVIIALLYRLLFPYMDRVGGVVLFAALRLQIREGKFREPDLMLLLDANDLRRENRYWRGADLVIEVVSEDDPERDTRVKRADYAEGRIPEYWIVNPAEETVTVLRLADTEEEYAAYAEHGVFRRGETATSALLPDFSVQVSAILDAH